MSRHAPGSVGFVQDAAARVFTDAGIDTARLDARLLMAHGLQRDAAWLIGHPEEELTPAQFAHLEALISRRAAREPLAYILGGKEFWSLEFKISPATLVPRPESETLVEIVLRHLSDNEAVPRVLDLGTGSGCLVLSVLHEVPGAEGVGVDRSADALQVAGDNAKRLGLAPRCRFIEGSWFSALDSGDIEPFDVVLTNPPYIANAEMADLAPEILGFEPAGSLRGGVDGLDCYREIMPGLAAWLRPGGLFAGEIGETQGAQAMALALDSGLVNVKVLEDAAGRPRCLIGHWPVNGEAGEKNEKMVGMPGRCV